MRRRGLKAHLLVRRNLWYKSVTFHCLFYFPLTANHGLFERQGRRGKSAVKIVGALFLLGPCTRVWYKFVRTYQNMGATGDIVRDETLWEG